MKDRSGYWKPKEPLLVYDYPLAPTRGDTPMEILDNLVKDNNDRPDAYDVVSKVVMDIACDKLECLGDVIIGLRVGDHDTTIRGEFDSYKGNPVYHVAYWDWWEGEEKIWINYIVLEDYVDELMEGVECNA